MPPAQDSGQIADSRVCAARHRYDRMSEAELGSVASQLIEATLAKVPVLCMLAQTYAHHADDILLQLALTLEPLAGDEKYRDGWWGRHTGLVPGTVVLAQGQGATELVFVLSGTVEVEAPPPTPEEAEATGGGSPVRPTLIGAGGCFGGALNLPSEADVEEAGQVCAASRPMTCLSCHSSPTDSGAEWCSTTPPKCSTIQTDEMLPVLRSVGFESPPAAMCARDR